LGTVWELSIALISSLQSLGSWLAAPMAFLSLLGQAEFYLVFFPALYWCWDARVGLRLTLALLLSASLNDALKVALHQPRPYWVDPAVLALRHESSFGVPSGHAQNAVSVWGVLAAWLNRPWAWAGAGALACAIGLSRLYLGVHFAHDVALGWLIGGLLLVGFLRWGDAVREWYVRRSLAQQVTVALVASWLLLLLAALSHLLLSDWRFPAEWIHNALAVTGELLDPANPENALNATGMLFGLGAGWSWLRQRGGFRQEGPAWKRAARYGLGAAGLVVLWFGMRFLYAGQPALVEHALRYLRAALVGAWVAGAAPMLFVRLRLAEREAG